MDFVYLAWAALFWAAIWGLAAGCSRLMQAGGRS